MKNKKYVIMGILIGMILMTMGNQVTGIVELSTEIEDEIKITKLKTSDYYEESSGIYIGKTNEYDIVIISGNELYYINDTNNGTLYKVNLDDPTFTSNLVRGNLGDIRDMCKSEEDMYLATYEYNSAIMKLDLDTLMYSKIDSSPSGVPLKISAYLGLTHRLDLLWTTYNDVYHCTNSTGLWVTSLVLDGIYPEGVDIDYTTDAIGYNSTNIWTINMISKTYNLRVTSTDINSVCINGDEIYYVRGQYNDLKNGQIRKYDISESTTTMIKNDCDYPTDVEYASGYVYWIDKSYWSTDAMIYKCYYNGDYLTKISRAYGNSFSGKIEFMSNQEYGVYYDTWSFIESNIYVVNGSDITPPETIEWNSFNETIDFNSWHIIDWEKSYDLNGIQDYELLVSNVEDFSIYNTYWIPDDGELSHSYQRYDFSNMGYGDYYYKIRTRDNNLPTSNIGVWSDILKISYPEPEESKETEEPSIPGYPLILLYAIGIISVIYIIRNQQKR